VSSATASRVRRGLAVNVMGAPWVEAGLVVVLLQRRGSCSHLERPRAPLSSVLVVKISENSRSVKR
jgi:hypothetical protein